MCDQKQALAIMAEAYAACKEIFGDKLRDAYLYGSYARGDYDEYSDIDILFTVDMEPEALVEEQAKVWDINADLTYKHDVLVSSTVKPLTQFRRYASVLPYYKNVINEGISYGH